MLSARPKRLINIPGAVDLKNAASMPCRCRRKRSGQAGMLSLAAVTFVLLSTGPASAQVLTNRQPPVPEWNFADVKAIAAEIQAAAERARLAASQQTRPSRREQSFALTDLTALTGAAQHFSVQIDRFRQDPEPTRQDYLRLVAMHNQARQNVLNAGYDASVIRDFNQIEVLLDRLSLVYTQQWDRNRARAAAETLDIALSRALDTARQRAQDRPTDQRALFLLQRLAWGAQVFRQQLDREPDLLATYTDFHALLTDYTLALRSLYPLGFEHDLEGDLNRAGQALVQLRQAYQVPWNGPNARTTADQVRIAARLALERVAEQAARDGGAESRLLDHFRLLAELSDQLARHLELSPEMPLRTYPDFLILAAAYREASFDLLRAWFGPQMLGEINSMGRELAQLGRMYSWAVEQGAPHLTGTVIGSP
jgi:hypothetical protein